VLAVSPVLAEQVRLDKVTPAVQVSTEVASQQVVAVVKVLPVEMLQTLLQVVTVEQELRLQLQAHL
jgi:hypothetical protein